MTLRSNIRDENMYNGVICVVDFVWVAIGTTDGLTSPCLIMSDGEICGPPDTVLVDGDGGLPSPIICTDGGSKNRLVAE